MLYEKFIRLVEDHAEAITKEWIKEIKSNPSTTGYRSINDDVLGTRIYDVFKKLGSWVTNTKPDDPKIAEHFVRIGRERASENMKNSEVIYALILARVVLWRYIVENRIILSAIDLQQSLEFYQKINNFFDKATYFVAVGFESVDLSEQEKKNNDEFIEKAVKSVTSWFIKKK